MRVQKPGFPLVFAARVKEVHSAPVTTFEQNRLSVGAGADGENGSESSLTFPARVNEVHSAPVTTFQQKRLSVGAGADE
jgi:hypothetical protein